MPDRRHPEHRRRAPLAIGRRAGDRLPVGLPRKNCDVSSNIDEYRIDAKPFYRPTGNEIELYEHAYSHRMPMILKGPTGCGKTRFIEFMAWKLGRPSLDAVGHAELAYTTGQEDVETAKGDQQTGHLAAHVSIRRKEIADLQQTVSDLLFAQLPSLVRPILSALLLPTITSVRPTKPSPVTSQ